MAPKNAALCVCCLLAGPLAVGCASRHSHPLAAENVARSAVPDLNDEARSTALALAWIGELERASAVEVELFAHETVPRLDVAHRQYARGTYTPEGFRIETWTTEQFARGVWSVDDHHRLVTDEPAGHTLTLTGSRVRETITLDEPERNSITHEYERLQPAREVVIAQLRAQADRESERAGLAGDERSVFADRYVAERLPDLMQEIAGESGVPITRASQRMPCITACALGGYLGDTWPIDWLRESVNNGAWLTGDAEHLGERCDRLRVTEGLRTETLWFNERTGLVRWDLEWARDAPESGVLGELGRNDAEPESVLTRTFAFTIIPGD